MPADLLLLPPLPLITLLNAERALLRALSADTVETSQWASRSLQRHGGQRAETSKKV